jgi:hypothetical protein
MRYFSFLIVVVTFSLLCSLFHVESGATRPRETELNLFRASTGICHYFRDAKARHLNVYSTYRTSQPVSQPASQLVS